VPVEQEGGLDPAIASMMSAVRKLRTPVRNALPCQKNWRFVGAAGKVEFEPLHLNVAPAQPDFPLRIQESSYVALVRV